MPLFTADTANLPEIVCKRAAFQIGFMRINGYRPVNRAQACVVTPVGFHQGSCTGHTAAVSAIHRGCDLRRFIIFLIIMKGKPGHIISKIGSAVIHFLRNPGLVCEDHGFMFCDNG